MDFVLLDKKYELFISAFTKSIAKKVDKSRVYTTVKVTSKGGKSH